MIDDSDAVAMRSCRRFTRGAEYQVRANRTENCVALCRDTPLTVPLRKHASRGILSLIPFGWASTGCLEMLPSSLGRDARELCRGQSVANLLARRSTPMHRLRPKRLTLFGEEGMSRVALMLFALCSVSAELLGQSVPLPAFTVEDLPAAMPDAPQTRDIAKAFAHHLCNDTKGALRVTPFRQVVDTTYMPRLPDIAPGVLGTFFLELAGKCKDSMTTEVSAGSIQLMGFRQSNTSEDSVAVVWQVRTPTIDDTWSVTMRRGWAVHGARGWEILGVTDVRHELYRRLSQPPSAPPA